MGTNARPDETTQGTTMLMHDVTNPYTGEVVAQVRDCGADAVDAACRTAEAALRRGLPQHERARILDRAAELLGVHGDPLARLITSESGKAVRDARGEVGRAAETLRFAATECRRLGGEVVPMEATPAGTAKLGLAMRLPVGVVAAITPFNFPLNTVAHKVAPAIAAGCPVVLKPAHQTPLTALRFIELLQEAGLPVDWVTVVTDSGTTAGPALVEHPVPRLMTFTGSTEVGWGIAAKAFRKRVALELGSNAPVIVEPDSDVTACAERIARAAYSTAGQSCISVQRVIVHEAAHAELLTALAKVADSLVVGDPLDDRTDVGPLITPEATERVHGWIRAAEAAGARVVAGGFREGACLRPTVVDQPPVGTDLRDCEVFGPVLSVHPYSAFDEAMAIANETPYGLQAGIFTNDLTTALTACRRLNFGGVLVNDVPTVRVDQQPYGGVGDSGNTREGPVHAIEAMTEVRFLSLQAAPGSALPGWGS